MTFEKLNTTLMWKEISRFALPIETIIKHGFNHIPPLAFEEFIKELFEIIGFDSKLTPQTGDGGIDIFLYDDEKKIAIVQCKRYDDNSTIGSKEVREFLGAMTHSKSDYGYFITTSQFSESAKSFVEDHKNIFLMSKKSLERLFRISILSAYGQLEN